MKSHPTDIPHDALDSVVGGAWIPAGLKSRFVNIFWGPGAGFTPGPSNYLQSLQASWMKQPGKDISEAGSGFGSWVRHVEPAKAVPQ